MHADRDLEHLMKNLEPVLHSGEYIFTSLTDEEKVPWKDIIACIREEEGMTFVMERQTADDMQLPYAFIAAWITLNVHSALHAVGLTAAFSAALARRGISCNVIAGYYHDHLFVPAGKAQEAIRALQDLVEKSA